MPKNTGETTGHRIMRRFRNRFVAGILIIIPLAITVWAIYWVFSSVDSLLQPLITWIFKIEIPGLGLVIFLVLVFLIGLIASNYAGKKIIFYSERLLTRVPVFRQLYIGAKQVVQGLSGAGLNKAAFREVVYVEFPREGMKTLAFVTNQITDSSGTKYYAIYVPTAPVPTSGYFEMVTEDKITRANISVDEAMKVIISSGMILPQELKSKNGEAGLDSTPNPQSQADDEQDKADDR